MFDLIRYFGGNSLFGTILPPSTPVEVAIELHDGDLECLANNQRTEFVYIEFNKTITYRLKITNENFRAAFQVEHQSLDFYQSYYYSDFIYLKPKYTTKIYMNVSNKDTWMSLCKKNIILLRPNIKQLVTLQTLQLCCNYLTFLPDEICELRNLSRFIVAKNRLKQLPGNIGLLRNLRELNVAGNALTSLPKSFTSLRQLTFLILNDNRISELSHELSGCISLKYLFVARNRIESLGAELMLLPFLKIIDYQSNPLEKNDFCAVQKDVYSLQELCARRIINCHTHIPVNTSLYIRNQLLKVRECFFCGGAFFDYWYEVNLSKVINETPVTFKAKLCKPHFRDQMEYVSKLLYLHDNRIGYHLCNENYPKISELFVLTSYLPRKLQEIRKFVKNKNKLPIDKIPLFTLIEGYDLINKEYVKYAGTLHRMTYKDDYRYSEPM